MQLDTAGNSGAAAPHRPWPVLAVTAVMAAGFAVALNVGKVPVSIPLLRQELGLSLVQAGWLSSTLNTAAVVGAALVGMWVGRLGALRMVLAGLLLGAMASLLAGWWAQQWWGLLIGRLAEGLSFMVVAVACPALITAACAPSQQRMALSLWSTYMPAGAGLAMALAPSLLPTLGWRGLWLATAAALTLAAFALWRQRRAFTVLRAASASASAVSGTSSASGTPTASFFGPVREALRQPLPWALALSFTVWAAQHFALIVWMPSYLMAERGLPLGKAALLTAGMLLACVPGNLLGGVLMQRGVSRGALLVMAQCLTGLGALAYSTTAWPDSARYAAAVAVSFFGGVIPAAVMASTTVLARTPQQIGTLQGLFTQGAHIGQFVGTPLIAALVAASGSWRSALWVTGGAALIGVGLGLLAWRLEQGRGLMTPSAPSAPSTPSTPLTPSGPSTPAQHGHPQGPNPS